MPDNVRPHPTARRRAAPPPAAPGPDRTRRLGRPSLLNDEVRDLIVGAMRVGATIRDAAAVAGVSEQAVHTWKARGADALEAAGYVPGQELDADEALSRIPETEHPFVEFSWAVASVSAQRKVAWLERVNRDRDWRASAWLLKHYHPDEFGDRLELAGSVDVEVHDPAEALLDRIRRLRPDAIDVDGTEVAPEGSVEALPAPQSRPRRRAEG